MTDPSTGGMDEWMSGQQGKLERQLEYRQKYRPGILGKGNNTSKRQKMEISNLYNLYSRGAVKSPREAPGLVWKRLWGSVGPCRERPWLQSRSPGRPEEKCRPGFENAGQRHARPTGEWETEGRRSLVLLACWMRSTAKGKSATTFERWERFPGGRPEKWQCQGKARRGSPGGRARRRPEWAPKSQSARERGHHPSQPCPGPRENAGPGQALEGKAALWWHREKGGELRIRWGSSFNFFSKLLLVLTGEWWMNKSPRFVFNITWDLHYA